MSENKLDEAAAAMGRYVDPVTALLKAALLALGFFVLTGAAKLPSIHDGSAQVHVETGREIRPVVLFGVAVDWDRQCRKGKGEQCDRLGDALQIGLGDLDIDPQAAAGFWLLACDHGSGAGCHKASGFLDTATNGYAARPKLALETAQKGCALRDGTSCAIVGLHLYRGDVVVQDRGKAMAIWDEGCASRNEESCRLKAGMLFHGDDAGDQARAVELYRAGCDRAQGWGCSGLADAYVTGVGVRADNELAYQAGEKGCVQASGDTVLACAIYARFLGQSKQAEAMGKAGKILARACLAGEARACNDGGRLGKRDPVASGMAASGVSLSFRKGCDLGYGPACGNLGQLYLDGFGRVKADKARAVALFDRACASGDRASCVRIEMLGAQAAPLRASRPPIDPGLSSTQQLVQAEKLIAAGERLQGVEAVARLMEEAVPEAEWLFGGWLYFGYPGVIDQVDRANGFILLENAARHGQLDALKMVGMAYWEGDGVVADQAKAMGYMGLAAQRGDPLAQATWRSMKMEPVRQDFARRQRAMDDAAKQQHQASFWDSYKTMIANWQAPVAAGPAGGQRWQSTASIIDQGNWNTYNNYMNGRTSACPASNPYC